MIDLKHFFEILLGFQRNSNKLKKYFYFLNDYPSTKKYHWDLIGIPDEVPLKYYEDEKSVLSDQLFLRNFKSTIGYKSTRKISI